MTDIFDEYNSGLESPARNAFAITPNDSTDLTTYTRGIYIGSAGDVAVTLAGDTSPVTFVGLLAGTILPVRAKRVLVTGTSAGSLVGLY